MVKQTAGHDALGQFAPEFAHLNDDVLFGEVWNRTDKLGLKERSIVTISALIGKGITDSSLKYHLMSAKNNGVTQVEMAEILTHIAFMPAGRTHGRRSTLPRKCTPRTTPRRTTRPNSTAAFSAWASPTTGSRNTSSGSPTSTR